MILQEKVRHDMAIDLANGRTDLNEILNEAYELGYETGYIDGERSTI